MLSGLNLTELSFVSLKQLIYEINICRTELCKIEPLRTIELSLDKYSV